MPAREPYVTCRYVRHYHAKNGYAPRVSELPCGEEYARQLQANGIIDVLPLYDGGPPVGVVLTEKGLRMAGAR
jgi:hypothetical protein